MKMSTSDWIMLLTLSGLWGCSYFLVEIALQGLPVMTLVAIRILLAALVLWIFVMLSGATVPRSLHIWRSFLFMGLLNNVLPFSLIVWGQTIISSSLAAILTATTPLFAVVVAAAWLRDEPVSTNKIFGLIIGFVGVVVMIGPEVIGELGQQGFAQIAVVLASLSYALASAYGRRFSAFGIKPVVSAAGQVTMSALLLVAFVALTEDLTGLPMIEIDVWVAVAALAIFSTAVAYTLYFRILASAGAMNLMLVTFLMPVTAIFLGVFVLDEQLGTSEIIGVLLISLALLAIDGRLFSALARKKNGGQRIT